MFSGKAYAPEFYYDARGALWQNRPRAYGFKLQWTQMEPGAVDRILAYRLGFRQVSVHANTGATDPAAQPLRLRQVSQSRWWEQQIPIEGAIQKGELLTYNLTELLKPESYLVRLTPITRFGEGDATERIISYSSEFAPAAFIFMFQGREDLTESFCPFTAPVNPHLSKFLTDDDSHVTAVLL